MSKQITIDKNLPYDVRIQLARNMMFEKIGRKQYKVVAKKTEVKRKTEPKPKPVRKPVAKKTGVKRKTEPKPKRVRKPVAEKTGVKRKTEPKPKRVRKPVAEKTGVKRKYVKKSKKGYKPTADDLKLWKAMGLPTHTRSDVPKHTSYIKFKKMSEPERITAQQKRYIDRELEKRPGVSSNSAKKREFIKSVQTANGDAMKAVSTIYMINNDKQTLKEMGIKGSYVKKLIESIGKYKRNPDKLTPDTVNKVERAYKLIEDSDKLGKVNIKNMKPSITRTPGDKTVKVTKAPKATKAKKATRATKTRKKANK